VQSLNKFAEAILGIISEASKSLLGILALLIIVVGILAYSFFVVKLTPKNAGLVLMVRLCAFLLVFSGACAFGWAVVRTLPLMAAQKAPAPANEQKEKTPTVQHNKPTVRQPGTTLGSPVTAIPVAASYQSEVARAAVFAGRYNVPGNPPQACESYARALHLVYSSLTPSERDLLNIHGSACSQGRSDGHVTILKEIAQQFEARAKTRDQ
jgi:hypothetical protein